MSDVPYFLPPEEGPLFPDDGKILIEEADVFLRVNSRDIEADVTCQNIRDMSDDSFKLWQKQQIKSIAEGLGINLPPDF